MICNSITNVAHSIVNKNINILYSNHNSLFDYLFKTIDYNIYYANDVVSVHYYDTIIINDFLSYHSWGQSFSNQYHIKPSLFLHDAPPSSFKKEDIALVHQNTKRVHRIIFGNHLANMWKLQPDKYVTVMDYGLPVFNSANKRDKSILIMNLQGNNNSATLHQHIKNHIGDCDILNTLPMSWSLNDICNLLSQYKIFIDLSHTVNSLVAASCGCQCISPHPLPKNKLISSITDYSNIISIIQILLGTNLSDDEREYNKNLLTTMFNYETFINLLSDKIKSLKEQELFLV